MLLVKYLPGGGLGLSENEGKKMGLGAGLSLSDCLAVDCRCFCVPGSLAKSVPLLDKLLRPVLLDVF